MNGEHHESGQEDWPNDTESSYKTLDELSREEILRALAELNQRTKANNEEDTYSLLARGILHSKV